jgi:hypothetical protein
MANQILCHDRADLRKKGKRLEGTAQGERPYPQRSPLAKKAKKANPVNAADFKTYIFPLLFFKRICDAWDEEYQDIDDETGDEQLAWFPESHRFQIPEDRHWIDVRAKARTSMRPCKRRCAK